MANQFESLIDLINEQGVNAPFTSRDLKGATAGVGNPKSVNSFLTSAYRMGIFQKIPIPNPGRGPRIVYAKLRSFTDEEKQKMTTYPDCIDFKKAVDAAYKEKIQKAAKKTTAKKSTRKTSKKEKKEEVVNVSAHQRRKPKKEPKKWAVKDSEEKTTVTFYKK